MKSNKGKESVFLLSNACEALRLYFEALEKEDLLPMFEHERNCVSTTLYELCVATHDERVRRSGPKRRSAVIDTTQFN